MWFLCAAAVLDAQVINLSAGTQTYASLSGATVTLSGKSELRLTGTSAVLSGSVVNLTSTDAAVVFTQVRPSVVLSTYLGQLRVNGAAATSGSNVRVVQFEMGAIVLPHAPSLQPLQAWSGPEFSGTNRTFAQYTYYNTTSALAGYERTISSFKLKRGYMATFATQPNGTGTSQVYVAQDGDLEIARLPAKLDNAIRFVRVLPWRWTAKKGSCDVGPTLVDAAWYYNWNNDGNVVQSTADYEFVPIRQQRYWPAFPTNKPESNHLLGFNEPDNPVEDAYETLGNGSIDTAIAVWPELLATGLRVGAPAVTDGGEAWLYEFIDKADAAGLRVDYVPIHFYRCGYSASQLYNWLYNIHVRTGRPLWVTEFNNGANWTGCADPTYQQNADTLNAFIEMMDSAPFIERYAVYSRVEGVRQITYDEGGLTPAGVVYKNNASPVSYVQRVPKNGTRSVAQFGFDGDAADSSGFGNNAVPVGRPAYEAGRSGQALRLDGVNGHVLLPPEVASGTAFSFAAWVKWDGGANWQRIFDFGRDTSRYMFLTPSSGTGTVRFAIRNNGSEQIVQTGSALPSGQWAHVAVTLSGGTARIYVNGVLSASGAISITPAQLGADLNYLAKSQFAADPRFAGFLDDVRISDQAFSAAQITAMQTTNNPPQFTSATINGGTGTQGQPYTGTLAGTATDADAGDVLTFAKAAGPAWLQVAANGALSGTPTLSDDGAQEFTLTVTDQAGASDSVVFTVTLPSVVGNGTWSADAAGSWGDAVNWQSAFPANGAGSTANFSALNISADRTVTLDRSRSIGNLTFGDTSGGQSWTLASNAGATLALDTGVAGTQPVITVNQNTATISAALEGTNGFTKGGNGTLVLAGGSSLTGVVNADTGSTTTAQGVLRIAHPDAISSVSSIPIRTNNSGSSTLELSGALGDIESPAGVVLSGRNTSSVGIRNISGANVLGGVLTLQSGGANYILQSDAGTLTFGGVTSAATTSRTITFTGAGGYAFTGVVSNGSATPVNFSKSGTGRLALGAANTFTGNVTINGGTVSLLGSGALYAGGHNTTAVVTVNTGGVLELDRWGYGPSGTYRTQALGGLSYAAERLVINGGTIKYTGGAAGAPLNPSESPYGPGFTIGSAGATLEAAKVGDTWTVKNDSRGGGPVVSAAGGTLILTGDGNGILDKVVPGTGGLNKRGAGTWTLPLANTYTGATTVTAGVLRVTGSTSTGTVGVASGATLAGTGTLGGAVSVASGGILEPGVGTVGTLSAVGNITLQSGAILRMQISKTAGSRDRLVTSGMLTLGGTLELTNLAGTLVAGDSFALLSAASYAGAFSAYQLPELVSGLEWNTSTLGTDGTLRVRQLTGFAGWALQNGLTAGAGFDADADADGLANGLEWLFGGNPVVSGVGGNGPQHALRALTVEEYPAAVAGRTYLTMTVRVRRDRPGVTLIPEAATTVEGLTAPEAATAVVQIGAPVADGEFDVVTYVSTTALEDGGTGRLFMRLRAVWAP